MTINLAESIRRIQECGDPNVLANDPEMQEFVSAAGKLGADVMSRITDDEKFGAVSLVFSAVVTDRLQSGDVMGIIDILKNRQFFDEVIAVAIRTTVGLAVMEEWH